MFISRREWEDKCDSNRALLKDKAEKAEIIEELRFQLENAEKHNMQMQEELKLKDALIEIQKERLENYNKNNDILMTANQKLIDWINKMINEVGVYEVHDRHSVTIPIYKNPVKAYSGNFNDFKEQLPDFMNQEEILIPEIRFVRMKNQGGN